MGLFDFFKKTPPTHDEKVNLAYKCFNEKMVKAVFPGEKQQASNIIRSLGKILNINLENCSAKEYHTILTMFSGVSIRRVLTQSNDERIIISLQVNHSEYIKDQATAEKVLTFCKLNMSDHSFVLDSEQDMALLESCSGGITENEKIAVENIEIQEVSIEDADYGICMNKPIYTNDENDTEIFLNSLKSSLGEDLVWEKQDTLDVDGIAGKVIVYASSLPSGKSYKTIYVNEHGVSAERKIPKGFSSVDKSSKASASEESEGYYFADPMEFAIYCKLHGKDKKIIWISADKYIELYKQGYQLFECGQYVKAINAFKESLKLNPIGISARFELVECYIRTKQLSFARKALYEMKEYLCDDANKARFYRRVGYVAIDEGSYKEAYACYKYSLNYENNPLAAQEIEYIEENVGKCVKNISIENTLFEYEIPIL